MRLRKVLVIGLDGATWRVLKPLIKENKVPTIKRLVERSVCATMLSTIPPMSVPAWNSLASGMNPSKLNAVDRVLHDLQYKSAWFAPFKGLNIWDILSRARYKVIVANVPHVRYAYKINGKMIAGFLCTNPKKLTYPEFLRKEIDKETGGYRVAIEKETLYVGIDRLYTKSEIIKKIYELDRKHYLAFRKLLEDSWDFAFLVFRGSDTIQHITWNKSDLENYFARLDGLLYNLIKMVDEETYVFLVSDHGFGPGGRVLNINEWLANKGFLRYRVGTFGRMKKLFDTFLINHFSFLMPPVVRYLPRSVVEKIAKEVEMNLELNLDETIAFSLGTLGEIWINNRIEENALNNSSSDVGTILQKIIDNIRNLVDERGERLFLDVLRREEIYKNGDLTGVARLFLLPSDDIPHFQSKVGTGLIFENRSSLNSHRIDGIFAFHTVTEEIHSKAMLKTRKRGGIIKIYDVAPTILRLLKLPIPPRIDGVSLI